jgi:hypothetical protein
MDVLYNYTQVVIHYTEGNLSMQATLRMVQILSDNCFGRLQVDNGLFHSGNRPHLLALVVYSKWDGGIPFRNGCTQELVVQSIHDRSGDPNQHQAEQDGRNLSRREVVKTAPSHIGL